MTIRRSTPDNSAYNRASYVENGAGELAIKTILERYAPHRNKPTTAAADPSLRIPEALQQVDPQMLSQVLPQMYTKFMQVRNLMIAFNSRNGSTDSNTSPNGYARTAITDVFSGALALLVQEYGYYEVLDELFRVLGNDGYLQITEDYQDIVFESIIKLIQLADENGETDIPVSTIPAVTYGSDVPTPLYDSYEDIPDYYVQQYYTEDNDPYPGYIEYKNSDDESVYIRREDNDYPYESAEQEIFTTAEYQFAEELSPYFDEQNLTVAILDRLLIAYCTQIINDTIEQNAGKNSNSNLQSMLTTLAGIAGQMAASTISDHLPNSVLDVSSMTSTLQEHQRNIGKLKMMKQFSSGAFEPMQLLNSAIRGLMTSSLSSGNSSSTRQIAANIAGNITS